MAADLTPAALLTAWEAAATPEQRAAQAPHQAAVLTLLNELSGDQQVLDEAATVVRGADRLRAITVAPTSPVRATATLRHVFAALPLEPARQALVQIQSGPAEEFEIDELNTLTLALLGFRFGRNCQQFLSHEMVPTIPTGCVRVYVLLAYDA